MENNSILASKISQFIYTYNMVGTKTILLYKRNDNKLYTITKDGVILTESKLVDTLNYKEFISTARKVYNKTLEKMNYKNLDYTTILS